MRPAKGDTNSPSTMAPHIVRDVTRAVAAPRSMLMCGGTACLALTLLAALDGHPDWAYFLPGVVLLLAGLAGTRPALIYGTGAAAVLLLGWVGLSQAAWGADHAPQVFGPVGFTAERSWGLGLLLCTWFGAVAAWPEDAASHPRIEFALVLAFTVARLWPLITWDDIDFILGDEGWLVYTGYHVVNGAQLYTDIFQFLWPGSFLTTAVVGILGGESFAAIHVAEATAFVICALTTYSCTRRETSPATGLFAVLLLLTAIGPAAVWWSAHWLSVTSGMLVVVLLSKDTPRTHALAVFGAGLAAGWAIMCQQHRGAGIIGGVGIAYALLMLRALLKKQGENARIYGRKVGIFFLGVLAPVGPFLLYYAYRGEFAALKEATWDFLWDGYAKTAMVDTDLIPLNLSLPLPELLRGMWSEGSWTVAHLTLFAFPVAVFIPFAANMSEQRRQRWLMILLTCTGVASGVILRPQYLRWVYASPATLILLVAGSALLLRRAVAPRRYRLAGFGALSVLAVSMAVHSWGAQSADLRHRPKLRIANTALGPVSLVSYANRSLDDVKVALEFLTEVDDSVECYNYPVAAGFDLLTGRVNPTKYTWVFPGHNTARQVRELAQALRNEKVPYILRDRFYTPKWLAEVMPGLKKNCLNANPVAALIRKSYTPIVKRPTLTIYERKSHRAAAPSCPPSSPSA